jgi:hypothetical protein
MLPPMLKDRQTEHETTDKSQPFGKTKRAKFCDRTDKNVNFENEIKLDLKIKFEQTFKNIDDILYKDSAADSELDYIGQTSWVMFLRYLDKL